MLRTVLTCVFAAATTAANATEARSLKNCMVVVVKKKKTRKGRAEVSRIRNGVLFLIHGEELKGTLKRLKTVLSSVQGRHLTQQKGREGSDDMMMVSDCVRRV